MRIAVENNRVVIDTNVLISALIGQYSFPYKILYELALSGEIIPCLSSVMLQEYNSVSQREKFQHFPAFTERAPALIAAIQELSFWIEPAITIEKISDLPDNRFVGIGCCCKCFASLRGTLSILILKPTRTSTFSRLLNFGNIGKQESASNTFHPTSAFIYHVLE